MMTSRVKGDNTCDMPPVSPVSQLSRRTTSCSVVRLALALPLLAACAFASAQQQPQQDDRTEAHEQRAPISPNAPLHAQCQQSIDRAVKYLLAHQGELGAWIENERDADAPGRTALVGLAL